MFQISILSRTKFQKNIQYCDSNPGIISVNVSTTGKKKMTKFNNTLLIPQGQTFKMKILNISQTHQCHGKASSFLPRGSHGVPLKIIL